MVKGRVATEENVRDHAHTPDVNGLETQSEEMQSEETQSE
jgi:hypothetical protein